MNHKALSCAVLLASGVLVSQAPEPAAAAQAKVYVYGPGGPLPAMKVAAEVFGKANNVAGRLGDIGTVKAFRANITTYAANSADARAAWEKDKSLDTVSIYRLRQIGPDAADLAVGLIDPPGLARLTGKAIPATLKFRHETLLLAHNRRVSEGTAAFGHHLHQVSEAQFEAQIPPHTWSAPLEGLQP